MYNAFMQNKWREIFRILATDVAEGQYKVWITPLSFTCEGKVVVAHAPTPFMVDFVRRRFSTALQQAVAAVFGPDYSVAVRHASAPLEHAAIFEAAPLATSVAVPAQGDVSPASLHAAPQQEELSPPVNMRPVPRSFAAAQLALPVMQVAPRTVPSQNWRFSFDDFVVGPCNELAYAASRSVSSANAMTSMLFLNSAPGLGKTHLMHAAGRMLSDACNKTAPKSAYLTAEEFASRFVQALRTNNLDSFKGQVRNLDLFLLEDVHFLQGKDKIQLELLSTIKALQNNGARVVLTSSFAPREMRGFDEQLLSRFYTGFVSGIDKPDKATRKRIFQYKAMNCNASLSEDVADVLAEHVCLDVRQIESCLQNLLLKAQLHRSGITMQMAWEVIGNFASQAPLADLDGIIRIVCEVFGLTSDQLFSDRRKHELVAARNAAFYLARKHTDLSLDSIGQRFNRRHSTVLKGITNLEREMSGESPKGRQMAQTIAMIERNNGLASPSLQ